MYNAVMKSEHPRWVYTHRTAIAVLLGVLILSLSSKLYYKDHTRAVVVDVCHSLAIESSKHVAQAKQDQSDTYRLVHSATARAYLNAALKSVPADELSKYGGIDVMKLSRAIDEQLDKAMLDVKARTRSVGKANLTSKNRTSRHAR